MDKIKKVVSLNLMALLGWFNIVIQSLYFREMRTLDPSRAGAGDIWAWFTMAYMGINIVLIGIALFSLLIEYLCISPNAKFAFKFPYEKIKFQSLYNIFFFGGLIGIVLPLIAIPLFTIYL